MVLVGKSGKKSVFSFRKLCSALRAKNFLEHFLFLVSGIVGHRLLVRNCDRPQVVFSDRPRALGYVSHTSTTDLGPRPDVGATLRC